MILELASLLCAGVPAGIFCANLRIYTPPPPAGPDRLPRISILIPARNEEAGIAECVSAALQSTGGPIEVIVMDDSSTDRTPEIVRGLIASQRGTGTLHLEYAPTLPPGWNGKQHACWE